MYKVLTKKEIKEFDQDIMNQIKNELYNDIQNFITTNQYTEPILKIGVSYHDIPCQNINFPEAKKLNFWVECEILVMNLQKFSTIIIEIIIFDEMPNIVLDRFNKLKEEIENNLNSK